MPYVTLRTIKELLTPELKAKFIARISEAVADVIVEDSGADREKVLANTWRARARAYMSVKKKGK